ncbi:hypothetical protein M011DRAFT_488429 [Sporormia fimetaria CBS 119925]|uniref:Uncharacterized protein n=1 Tax=Sporormia fimetaria CBS 119925 TaxID=1340428 RepID=A0A6A6V559_9PLEO|nr:hypothetical protein M011DRAFT_488429 [Sporormia fimetaria CBS 119925]
MRRAETPDSHEEPPNYFIADPAPQRLADRRPWDFEDSMFLGILVLFLAMSAVIIAMLFKFLLLLGRALHEVHEAIRLQPEVAALRLRTNMKHVLQLDPHDLHLDSMGHPEVTRMDMNVFWAVLCGFLGGVIVVFLTIYHCVYNRVTLSSFPDLSVYCW